MGVAETVENVALPVVDADAVSDVGDASLDGSRALLSDVYDCVGAFACDLDAGCFVYGPLADEFAFGGEDFDAVVFSVADDDEIVV